MSLVSAGSTHRLRSFENKIGDVLKKIFVRIILITFIVLLFPAQTVRAHPADLYAHTITITLSPTEMHIKWQIKPGPLLVNFIWNEMDADQDGIISDAESESWSASRLDLLTVSLDGKSLPLTVESAQVPRELQAFQAGQEFIVFDLSAELTPVNNTRRIIIENGMETTKSINWFYLTAEDGTAFLFPAQKSHIFTIDHILNPASIEDQSRLLTAWDSGAPALPFGQKKDVVTETAEQVVPELSERSPQEILLDLVRSKELSLPFTIFSLVIALALGALHALTPGHGKTVVAAYLVGSRGTAWHAVVLGSVVTLTHTGSVFALGLLTLTASRYFFTPDLLPYLEILSGALILILGVGLLIPRLRDWQKSRRGKNRSTSTEVTTDDGKKRLVINQPIEESGPRHKHDGEIPRKPQVGNPLAELSWRSLIALGISGGLVPCPDAIAILLVAVAINRILFGLTLILSFSLGLAVILIVIGMVMVNSRRLFDRMEFLDRFAPVMPVVSSAVVILLGAALTWGAVVKAKTNLNLAAPVQGSVNDARVLYLRENEDRIKQLFITEYAKDTSQLVSEATQIVADYAVSPDQTQAAYIIQNDSASNEIWLADLDSLTRTKLAECVEALCSGIVWSPNGSRIMYENMSLDSNNSGLPTLWWVDIVTSEAQPVFQDSQLPGGNPRWSPNGEWLSYSTPEGIRLYNLEDGETRVIENILGAAAMWSPDGKSILLRDVVIKHDQFVTQLFLYDLASETLVNISPGEGFENTLAAWSPDGSYIAVVRRDLSIPRGDQIWVMRADGSDANMLTNDAVALHGSLNWSPDGKYLLYELYALEAFPFSSRLQVLDVESGEVNDLELQGFNPRWVW